LKAGDLIAEEEPVLTWQKGLDTELLATDAKHAMPKKVDAQLEALSEDVKNQAMALHDCHGSSKKSLQGIMSTNALSRGANSCDSILCLEISRFNHSCVPNCQHAWDEEAGMERVFACTNVKAGEELSTSYIELRQDRQSRQRELSMKYKFDCACPACRMPDASSDRRRIKMQYLDEKILQVGARDQIAGVSLARELLELYDKEGIYNLSLRGSACYDAFQLTLPLRDLRGAKAWVQKAYDFYALGEGPDNPTSTKMLEYVKDPKSHRNWM